MSANSRTTAIDGITLSAEQRYIIDLSSAVPELQRLATVVEVPDITHHFTVEQVQEVQRELARVTNAYDTLGIESYVLAIEYLSRNINTSA